MNDLDKQTMHERIEDEFDVQNVHFTGTMKARVVAQMSESLNGASHIPAERTSFWQQKIAIPLPVLLIPISIAVVIMGVVFVESRGSESQPADSIVISQGGSMYTLMQLAQGEASQ